jgi:hypothetical protein
VGSLPVDAARIASRARQAARVLAFVRVVDR